MKTLMVSCSALLLLMSLPFAQAKVGDMVATLAVHGRPNCLEVDYRKVALPIALDPGTYCANIEKSPGIAYGQSAPYDRRRAQNVLLDFDNTKVSALGIADGEVAPLSSGRPMAVGAVAQPVGDLDLGAMPFYVKAKTTAYAYVVDRNPADNSGSVRLGIHNVTRKGPWWHKSFVIDGRRNCVKADVSKMATALTLKKGEYELRVGEGAIIYGDGKHQRLRAARNVLLDFDPADVDTADVAEGKPTRYPVVPLAAFGLNSRNSGLRIRVLRDTTIYAYVIDYHAAGNSGSVKVEVTEGLGRPWF